MVLGCHKQPTCDSACFVQASAPGKIVTPTIVHHTPRHPIDTHLMLDSLYPDLLYASKTSVSHHPVRCGRCRWCFHPPCPKPHFWPVSSLPSTLLLVRARPQTKAPHPAACTTHVESENEPVQSNASVCSRVQLLNLQGRAKCPARYLSGTWAVASGGQCLNSQHTWRLPGRCEPRLHWRCWVCCWKWGLCRGGP